MYIFKYLIVSSLCYPLLLYTPVCIGTVYRVIYNLYSIYIHIIIYYIYTIDTYIYHSNYSYLCMLVMDYGGS